MKTPLLFLVILIAFLGCRKAEKQNLEPTKVHEINVGKGLSWRTIEGKIEYGFKEFWKFDLIHDSVYYKLNTTFIDEYGYTQIRGVKYNYRKDSLALRLIQEALQLQNGKAFLRDPKIDPPLDGPEVHVIQYKRDSLTKYFFYQLGPSDFGPFISRLKYIKFEDSKTSIAPHAGLKDDTLAQFISKNNKFKFIIEPISQAVERKIDFSPPKKANGN
jgi:hypothetical protein